MSRFAKITLEVTVELETEIGIDTPEAYEPPFDYLIIREVSCSKVDLSMPLAARSIIDHAELDGLDSDDMLIDGVRAALFAATTEPTESKSQ